MEMNENKNTENEEMGTRAANCTGCNYAKKFSDNGRLAWCVKGVEKEEDGKWVETLKGC